MTCVCPVISAFLDKWPLPEHAAPRLADVRSAPALSLRRAQLATDWYVREYAPAWLDSARLPEHAQALRDLPEVVAIDGPLRDALVAARDAATVALDAACNEVKQEFQFFDEPWVDVRASSYFFYSDAPPKVHGGSVVRSVLDSTAGPGALAAALKCPAWADCLWAVRDVTEALPPAAALAGAWEQVAVAYRGVHPKILQLEVIGVTTTAARAAVHRVAVGLESSAIGLVERMAAATDAMPTGAKLGKRA